MPHYFFDIQDGVAIPDTVGATFRSLAEARAEAVRRSIAVLHDASKSHDPGEAWTIKVKNDWGQTLFTLHFSSDHPAESAPPAAPVRPLLQQVVDRYRRRAAEMAAMGAAATTEAIRTEHLELEKLWLEMAAATQSQMTAEEDLGLHA